MVTVFHTIFMRAFRIAYILGLGFLLFIMVITLTIGFFPPPTGPSSPQYPSFSSEGSAYESTYKAYDKERARYGEEQQDFVGDKIVPYVRNVITAWIVTFVVFIIAGMFFARTYSEIVGAGFAFSGVFAVVFGPIGSLVWLTSSLVSAYSGRAAQEYNTDSIAQAAGITTLLGVITLTLLGIMWYGKRGVLNEIGERKDFSLLKPPSPGA